MRPARNGWHWPEWSAEAVGTAILLFAVVTAQDLAVRSGVGVGIRIAIVAVVGGLVVITVAATPLGRRSGAHLNPAVTLGFWLQRTTSAADLAGYCVAQVAGGILGTVSARVWGPTVPTVPVEWAVIEPSISAIPALLFEIAATLVQLVVVYAFLTAPRLRPWTPVVATILLISAVIALAQLSGAGFNPIRALAPDLPAGRYPDVWIFIAGPLIGAALAAATVLAARRKPLTGKLLPRLEASVSHGLCAPARRTLSGCGAGY